MSRARRITVSREGLYYLVVVALIFGGALFRQVNLLLVLAGMIAGPLVVSIWFARRTLRGLTARRKLPRQLAAGEMLIAGVAVENPRRRLGAWAVVVEDEVQREGDGPNDGRQRPSVIFPYVPAGDERKATYRGAMPRRGRYRFGPLRLSTRFPFGLFAVNQRADLVQTLVVLPRLGRLAPGWWTRRRPAIAGAHRRAGRAGADGDYYGLRPWRSGDSRRWIHWRTSARRGQLMVRELEQPRNRDVALLLDLGHSSAPTAEEADCVELAVSFAATVATELCRRGGSTLSLFTTDARQTPLVGPASAALLNEVLQRLALVEPSAGDRTAALVEQAFRTVEAGTELVLVTTRPVDLDKLDASALDPRQRAGLKHLLCIDTSSEKLAEYFVVE